MPSQEELKAKGYQSVARADEVPEGRPMLLQLGERQLVLYRVQDTYYATDGLCPHAAGPLGAGDLEGFEVICPLHGWSFDIRDGKCTNVPGNDIESIAVEILDGELFLRLEG